MNKRQSFFQLLISLSIVVLINFIASLAFYRFDLTAEKRYTLSPATKTLIKNLNDVLYIKVYLEGEFPAGFTKLHDETKEMLDEFRAYSNNNIQYDFINPSESGNEKTRYEVYQQLSKMGLQPTNLEVKEDNGTSQKVIFPGAIFSYQGRSLPLQLLKSQIGVAPEEMLNNSVQALEYEISNTIRKLQTDFKDKIAFVEGHGELSKLETADITRALGEYYKVDRVRMNEQINCLRDFKAAIIAKPDSTFSEKDKFILDQFIMKGGKVLWLIDPVLASMDSLGKEGLTLGISNSVNLEDQLFKYGVRINTNLIQDLQAAPIPIVTGVIGNQPQQKLYAWYYFPLVMPKNSHPIVNNLNAVRLEFASSIDTVGNKKIKKTILLSTSQYTKLLNTPVRISLRIIEHEPDIKQYHKSFQPVAVLLEGEFESVYKNRLTPQMQSDSLINFKEQISDNKMIIVSDGDVIKNQIQKSNGNVYPLGYDKFTQQNFGNKNFILNCVNYLLDDSGLISVRSRELKLRLLDKSRIEKEKLKWQLTNVVLPIFLIILLGSVQFIIRKESTPLLKTTIKMNKKNRNSLILLLILSIVALLLYRNYRNSTVKKELTNFAVTDTSGIDKIFLANKKNQTVLLEKQPNGTWLVNKKYEARQYMVSTLLETIFSIRVKELIPKGGFNNIIKNLATKSTKIEIYKKIS